MAQFTAINLNAAEMSSSVVYAVQGGQCGGYARLASFIPPVLWSSPSPLSWQALSVAPLGGDVFGMSEQQQVGDLGGHASMWTGGAPSRVDLNPTGANASEAHATTGAYQAGFARFGTDTYPRAGIWHGTAQSWVNLNPAGAIGSYAWAAAADRQGGQVVFPGLPGQGSLFYAALWNRTAESFVNMSPGPNFGSSILGMSGDQQVGWVESSTMAMHASLCTGTAASWVDLHPHSDGMSVFYGTCGTAQVGYVSSSITGIPHAGIWFGTAQSFIDLGSLLPPGYGESVAYAVDEQNGVFTVGGYADHNGHFEAFIWVGVPSPSTAATLVFAGVLAVRRGRR